MPAIWSSPRSWSVGELVTAALMNAHLRDNLEFLKTPPTDSEILNEGADYTITSTSYVIMDLAKRLTITTAGGDVFWAFSGAVANSSGITFLDVAVDTVRLGGDDGLIAINSANARLAGTCFRLITGLSAGVHTFDLWWKVSAGTGTIYAGAGTANADLHPQMFVREIS